MTFGQVTELFESSDRVRILQGDVEVYNEFFANMRADTETMEKYKDIEIKRFRVIPEIRHRQWKEKGLMSPLKPEETPDFSFSDLQMKLYYTIQI